MYKAIILTGDKNETRTIALPAQHPVFHTPEYEMRDSRIKRLCILSNSEVAYIKIDVLVHNLIYIRANGDLLYSTRKK